MHPPSRVPDGPSVAYPKLDCCAVPVVLDLIPDDGNSWQILLAVPCVASDPEFLDAELILLPDGTH